MHTGNLLKEICYARSVAANIMMFEMASGNGLFLRVANTAVVEFGYCSDDTARFLVTVLPNGAVSLLCQAHQFKPNVDGSVGWYLALNSSGRLMGNSSINPNAYWIFVAASSLPVVADVSHTHDGVVSTNPLHAASSTMMNPTAICKVPDVFASVDSQVRWLGTAAGQEYLAREPYLLQLFFDQKIHMFMYRPDWPEAALRSVQISQSLVAKASSSFTSSSVSYPSGFPGINSPEEIKFFQQNGFAILRGVVPNAILAKAKRYVLHIMIKLIFSQLLSVRDLFVV